MCSNLKWPICQFQSRRRTFWINSPLLEHAKAFDIKGKMLKDCLY